MYFDQLLLAIRKWHVAYSDQLLGAAHYTLYLITIILVHIFYFSFQLSESRHWRRRKARSLVGSGSEIVPFHLNPGSLSLHGSASTSSVIHDRIHIPFDCKCSENIIQWVSEYQTYVVFVDKWFRFWMLSEIQTTQSSHGGLYFLFSFGTNRSLEHWESV